MKAIDVLVNRFDKDGIGAPPKHVYESMVEAMKEYAKQRCEKQKLLCVNEQFHESGDSSNAPEPEIP